MSAASSSPTANGDVTNPLSSLKSKGVVNTINKPFARWMANEQNGYPAIRSTRVTVSPIRETITVCAYRGIVDRKVWPA